LVMNREVKGDVELVKSIRISRGTVRTSLDAFLVNEIARVTVGAAVRAIGATVSVGVWAASPLIATNIAAGVTIWASSGRAGRCFSHSSDSLRVIKWGSASTSLSFAHVTLGTTVLIIGAAVSVGVWAATPLATAKGTARIISETSSRRARILGLGYRRERNCHSFACLNTLALGKIAGVSVRTTVLTIRAAVCV